MMNTCDQLGALYSTLCGEADLQDLVEMFVAEIPDRMATIRACYESRDLEALRRIAHQLKGAAGSYGFDPITQCAGTLENSIREHLAENEIARAVDELIGMCRRARSGAPGAASSAPSGAATA